MKNYLNRRDDPLDELVEAIQDLTRVLAMGREGITKQDLDNLETRITMKLSEVNKLVAEANDRAQEAFTEISERLAALEQQAQDPEVTNEEFLANLQSLKAGVDKLADIVPNEDSESSESETPETTPTV